MLTDADPQHTEQDNRISGIQMSKDDSRIRAQTPWTILRLYALGLLLVGGGISAAVVLEREAWRELSVMVIIILLMATAHVGGWTRRHNRPSGSALKRTVVRRRSRDARQERQVETGTPQLGDGRLPPDPPDARARDAVRAEAEV
jgi:hypothetical protein